MSKGPSLYFKELVDARRTRLHTLPKRPRCIQCRARRTTRTSIGSQKFQIQDSLVKQVTRLILSAAWSSSFIHSEVCSGQISPPKQFFVKVILSNGDIAYICFGFFTNEYAIWKFFK